jgi:hypothetical protein
LPTQMRWFSPRKITWSRWRWKQVIVELCKKRSGQDHASVQLVKEMQSYESCFQGFELAYPRGSIRAAHACGRAALELRVWCVRLYLCPWFSE